MLTTEQAAQIRDVALGDALRAHEIARETADTEFDFAVAKLRRIREEAHKRAAVTYRIAVDTAWHAYCNAAIEESCEIAAWTAASHYEKEAGR